MCQLTKWREDILKRLLIVVIAVLICIACVTTIVLRNKHTITEMEALQIAHKYVNTRFNHQFDGYPCDAELLDGVWVVAYGACSADNACILGGGTPVVKIHARSGRIISCLLQK
jgi:hypothetical protein